MNSADTGLTIPSKEATRTLGSARGACTRAGWDGLEKAGLMKRTANNRHDGKKRNLLISRS
jgi:hypothetical protein